MLRTVCDDSKHCRYHRHYRTRIVEYSSKLHAAAKQMMMMANGSLRYHVSGDVDVDVDVDADDG